MTMQGIKKFCGRGVLAAMLFALCAPAFAIGDKSAAYLKMDMGARAVGMGGAYVAADPDINTPWYNPAGPMQLTEAQMAFMYNRWICETSLSYAGYLQPSANGKSVFGAGLLYYNMGSIEKVTNSGYTTGGTYSAYAAVGLLTYARRVGQKLALGLNVKYIAEHIDSLSATAMAADIGMLYPGDKWNFGLAIQNIGQGMAFGEGGQSAPLPMVIRAGTRFKASEAFRITGELESADNFVIKAGFEYVKGNPAGTQYVGRFGYKTLKPSEFSGMTGMTLGLGLRRAAWTLDLGIVPYGSYGMTQWLTFTRRIGKAKGTRCRTGSSTAASFTAPRAAQEEDSYNTPSFSNTQPAVSSPRRSSNFDAQDEVEPEAEPEEEESPSSSRASRTRGTRF